LLPAANCLCEKLVFGCASLPLLDENDHVCAAGRCNSFAPGGIARRTASRVIGFASERLASDLTGCG